MPPMPLILRPPGESIPLPQRLAGLGRARKFAAVAAGVFTLAALVWLAAAVACLLDAWLNLPAGVRGIFLGGCLGLAGWLFVRGVRRPLREPIDPFSVALLLERHFPRMNDALASAVAFLERVEGPRAGAALFRKVAVIRAENLADRHELGVVVPSGKTWRSLWLFVAAAGVVTGLALADTGRATLALLRLADPFGNHPWPVQTQIAIRTPAKLPFLIAKGEPFDLVFAVRGVIPQHAAIELRSAGSPPATELVALAPAEAQFELVHSFKLDPSRVSRDFDLRITANDGDTGWHSVRVAPPPKLVLLNGRPSPQLHLEYPEYTQLPPADLPDGAAVVEAVAGTRLRVRAAADRRIVSAVFRCLAETPQYGPGQAAAPLAGLGGTAFGFPAAALLAEAATADIPVAVTGSEGRVLEAEFVPPLPGLYALRFTDEDGLTGSRLFDVRTFPDPSPSVALERPAAGQDALVVVPTSTLTVRARAEDRVFANRRLVLEYRVGDGPFVEVPLVDVTPAGVVLPAIASPAAAPVRPQAILLQGGRSLPVSSLKKPDGSSPADGDVIALRAAATDWDDVTLMKPPGRSAAITVRVLSPPSFDALIQKDLAGLRPELARVRDAQRESAEKLKELDKNLPPSGKLSADDREAIGQIELAQKQIQNKLADPRDGARAKAEQLRDLVRANDLSRTPVTERAEAVARALARLDDQHLSNIQNRIAEAKQAAEKNPPDPKAVKDSVAAVEKHQRGVTDGLDAALEQLERWAGAGELRGDVRGLKDQANKAALQSEKATDKVPDGKTPEQLSPHERAELNRAAEKFEQAANEASGVVAKAGRVAEEKAKQADALKAEAETKKAAAEKTAAGPGKETLNAEAGALANAASRAAAEAAALKNAVAKSGGQEIPNDLREAAKATRENRPGAASIAKGAADRRLDAMRDELAERKEDGSDELRKKAKQATDQVEKIAEEQDELRKKVKDAADKKDPAERAEELRRLAQEQEQLRQQAEQLARRLTRDGNDPAAEELKRAAEQMDQNREQLDQGKPPTEQQQNEAAERLQQAQDKLDAEKKQDEEMLLREKREELLKEFQGLVDRQKAAVAEAVRIEGKAIAAKRWERGVLSSLSELADREKALAEEVRRFAEKNLENLKVFDRMVRQAAGQMERGSKLLRGRKDDALNADPEAFDAEAEKAAGNTARRPMDLALRRLEQILASINPDNKDNKQAKQPMPGGDGGGGGGGGGGQQAGGEPPLAQLKALRDWQPEVNERTEAFAKDHPDPAKLTEDEADELKELEQAQKDIAELFEQLLPLFQKQGPEIP
jgi:hypothetical protein